MHIFVRLSSLYFQIQKHTMEVNFMKRRNGIQYELQNEPSRSFSLTGRG